jgi:hypothetical protein
VLLRDNRSSAQSVLWKVVLTRPTVSGARRVFLVLPPWTMILNRYVNKVSQFWSKLNDRFTVICMKQITIRFSKFRQHYCSYYFYCGCYCCLDLTDVRRSLRSKKTPIKLEILLNNISFLVLARQHIKTMEHNSTTNKSSTIFNVSANIIDSQRCYIVFHSYTVKVTALNINNSHTNTPNIVQNLVTE